MQKKKKSLPKPKPKLLKPKKNQRVVGWIQSVNQRFSTAHQMDNVVMDLRGEKDGSGPEVLGWFSCDSLLAMDMLVFKQHPIGVHCHI